MNDPSLLYQIGAISKLRDERWSRRLLEVSPSSSGTPQEKYFVDGLQKPFDEVGGPGLPLHSIPDAGAWHRYRRPGGENPDGRGIAGVE